MRGSVKNLTNMFSSRNRVCLSTVCSSRVVVYQASTEDTTEDRLRNLSLTEAHGRHTTGRTHNGLCPIAGLSPSAFWDHSDVCVQDSSVSRAPRRNGTDWAMSRHRIPPSTKGVPSGFR